MQHIASPVLTGRSHGSDVADSPNGCDHARLRERLTAFAIAGEACWRWMDRDEPNLTEIRKLLQMMRDIAQEDVAPPGDPC